MEGDELPSDPHREAELLQRARHFAGNRELHPNERKAVLLLARADDSLNDIERATRDIMRDNLPELPRNLGQRIEQAAQKIDRHRAMLTLTAFVASPLLRHGLQVVAGPLAGLAGTLTGLIIGGGLGAMRGYFTEQKKQFSPEAVKEEFDRIKSESNEKSALAFLHTMLQNRETDWMNFGGKLQLMALFLSDAQTATVAEGGETDGRVSPILNDEAVREILADASGLRNNYHSTAKSACVRAMWPAAKKGMLWGAGFGAISDVVSWFTASARAGHAAMEHRESVFSQDNAFRGEFHDKPLPLGDNFYLASLNESGLRETDFGNTLSRAISEGINAGKLHLPDPAYLVSSGTELARLPNDAAVNYATEFFKYAQPLPEHEYFYHGQDMAYNWEAIQKFLDFTYANGASPERMTDALMSADSIINATQEQMLTEGARQAAEVATRESLSEGLAHGVGIAAGASLGSRRSTPEPKQGGINLGGGTDGSGEAGGGGGGTGADPNNTTVADQANGGGGDSRTRATRQDDSEVKKTPRADAVVAEKIEPEQTTPQTEISFDYSKAFNWSELIADKEEAKFEQAASQILEDITENKWEMQGDMSKINFLTLCLAISNSRGKGAPKVRFVNEHSRGRYRIDKPPNLDDPTIILKKDERNSTETIIINLSDDDSRKQLESFTIKII